MTIPEAAAGAAIPPSTAPTPNEPQPATALRGDAVDGAEPTQGPTAAEPAPDGEVVAPSEERDGDSAADRRNAQKEKRERERQEREAKEEREREERARERAAKEEREREAKEERERTAKEEREAKEQREREHALLAARAAAEAEARAKAEREVKDPKVSNRAAVAQERPEGLVLILGPGTPSIGASAARKAYLGQTTVWSNGVAVRPYNRAAGSAAGKRFYRSVLGMSAGAFSEHWSELQLSGGGLAPSTVSSAAAVLAKVASTKGAVGYALASELPDAPAGVRLVPVE